MTGDAMSNLKEIDRYAGNAHEALERFKVEVSFAGRLSDVRPDEKEGWDALLTEATSIVKSAVAAGGSINDAVAKAEAVLEPISAAAKEYTIHCIGHAHIDMNWMWDWPETVATTNDTFTTVVKLMEEFPEFKFSQSQASVYQIMKDYLPELWAKVKKLIADGRWEVTASQWVEGDKNMASGEILCRHLLYTRRFMEKELGIPYDEIAIDWEPDTFGHPVTLPTILNKGGVRRYYLHRGAHGPKFFWWQGKDGSKVLTFDDCDRGYNGVINEHIVNGLFEFEKATGMKDYLFVYGVGDHGGGPTRRDIASALKMNRWPVFPNILLSTTDAFYSAAEMTATDLPVVDKELNTVEEGCYTSQSSIKFANRKSENALVEAELAAVLGSSLAAMEYPSDALYEGWRHAMFNQFHDILPGSGVRATYRYADGLFQEIIARTGMVKTRALRMVAGMVDTAACCSANRLADPVSSRDTSLGAGQGDMASGGSVSRFSPGNPGCDAFVVFNPNPWARSGVVTTRIWDRNYHDGGISVRDGEGKTIPAQVVERGGFWGHSYIGIAFPVNDVPGAGYKAYTVDSSAPPAFEGVCFGDGKGTIENEYLKVVVEQSSGAIIHLIDKKAGHDLVPCGKRLGMLEYILEAPHPMTAWIMGQVAKRVPLDQGATIECNQNGPHSASVISRHSYGNSNFTLAISLNAGNPRLDFKLDIDWLEVGKPSVGVPSLAVSFPLAVDHGVASFECPNGYVVRSTDPGDSISHTTRFSNCYSSNRWGMDLATKETPAQKWVDLSGRTWEGAPIGATLLNDCKYGFLAVDNTLKMTLLRSSYDPDPVTEQGHHTINFALLPHSGQWTVSDSTKAGYEFNMPLNVVGTGVQRGSLPASQGYMDILTPNVMVSGIKKSENGDSLVLRLYETEGIDSVAKVRIDKVLTAENTSAVETDIMEVPLETNSARYEDGILSVNIPAFGLVTVMIG